MKLEIKANFDFGKMANKLPKVIDKFLNESYADVVAKDSKKFIESGKVKYAGLDVFESQPRPEIQLLMNPEISMTPHIGASTVEAKDRAGIELANKIIELLSE